MTWSIFWLKKKRKRIKILFRVLEPKDAYRYYPQWLLVSVLEGKVELFEPTILVMGNEFTVTVLARMIEFPDHTEILKFTKPLPYSTH